MTVNYIKINAEKKLQSIGRSLDKLDLNDIDQWGYSEFRGRFIRLFPGDGVSKWGVIKSATREGLMVAITSVRSNGFHSKYQVGECHFLPWNKVTFYFCSKREATHGKKEESSYNRI